MLAYFLIISLGMLLIALNIYVMTNITNKLAKWISIFCSTFTFTRYIALIAFSISSNSHSLRSIAPFLFASSVGLTVPTALSILNLYNANTSKGKKMSPFALLLALMPFIIFYIALIIYAPKEIIQSEIGYTVELDHSWIIALSVVQAIFTSGVVFFSGKLFLEAKKRFITIRAVFLTITYSLIFIDGILRALNANAIPFAYVEVLAILSLLISIQYKKY